MPSDFIKLRELGTTTSLELGGSEVDDVTVCVLTSYCTSLDSTSGIEFGNPVPSVLTVNVPPTKTKL